MRGRPIWREVDAAVLKTIRDHGPQTVNSLVNAIGFLSKDHGGEIAVRKSLERYNAIGRLEKVKRVAPMGGARGVRPWMWGLTGEYQAPLKGRKHRRKQYPMPKWRGGVADAAAQDLSAMRESRPASKAEGLRVPPPAWMGAGAVIGVAVTLLVTGKAWPF